LAPIWLAVLVIVSFLMVSTWRFYSFKDLNLRSRHPFQIFILICAFFGLLVAFHHYMLFIIAITYAGSGIFTRLSYFFHRKPTEPGASAYKEAPESR
jgi:CDP-diacylglycerol--serine O-phosphatidyltransferase